MSTTWGVLLWGSSIAAVAFTAGRLFQWVRDDLAAIDGDVWPEELS